MSEQRHIIKRQIIELHVQGAAEAWRLQTEVSRIYRQRIVPLIDQYCTELSEPDRIHRIESLEVDLGYIDPARLEEELLAKVSSALRKALAEQIDKVGENQRRGALWAPTARTTSQLELFAIFARTGSLPWWVDATQPQLLVENLQHLIRFAPEALRRLMREFAREQSPLQRIIYQYGDESLAVLAGLLAPALPHSLVHELTAVNALLQKTVAAAGKSPAQLRWITWRSILSLASLQEHPQTAPAPLFEAVLRRVAAELGVSWAVLRSHLQQVRVAARPGSAAADLWAALGALTPHLPTPLQAQWQRALGDLARAWSTQETAPPAALQHILQLLQQGLAHQTLTTSIVEDWWPELQKLAIAAGLSPLQPWAPAENRTTSSNEKARTVAEPDKPAAEDKTPGDLRLSDAASTQPRPGAMDEMPLDLRFSDADEHYIGNAGLVILWPFLGNFFARLGLLADKQFQDAAAMQRAVGLLQHVATGEPAFPEYLLPLNKALCGMALGEVFDFGPPLSETETEECSDLLAAVVAQAPILAEMSAQGLRNTFLLRQGVLRVRDGLWLLQVERETYDIVLDRFPWSWEWVKLPWMEAPLRVEW